MKGVTVPNKAHLFVRVAAITVMGLLSSYDGIAQAEQPYQAEWILHFGVQFDESPASIALDSTGNAIVTGFMYGKRDAFLVKVDPSGNGVWSRQIGTNKEDTASTVVVDGSDNIYICGGTMGSLGAPVVGQRDAFLMKLDASGNELWSQQFGVSTEFTRSRAMAVDITGNVYVAGSTTGSLAAPNAGRDDVFLTKYDTSGNEVWSRQFGSVEYDWCSGAAVDDSGNVYITGTTKGSLRGPISGGSDAFLIKFDPTGNELWSTQFGTTESDSTSSVVVDSNNNVFVTGGTSGDLAGSNAGPSDVFMTKFDPSGVEVWSRQIGSNAHDTVYSMALDSEDNAYLTGNTTGNLGGVNAGLYDAYLMKFDTSGSQLWTRQIGTSLENYGAGVAVDDFGNVYLTGDSADVFPGSIGNDGTAYLAKFVIPEPTAFILLTLGGSILSFRRPDAAH